MVPMAWRPPRGERKRYVRHIARTSGPYLNTTSATRIKNLSSLCHAALMGKRCLAQHTKKVHHLTCRRGTTRTAFSHLLVHSSVGSGALEACVNGIKHILSGGTAAAGTAVRTPESGPRTSICVAVSAWLSIDGLKRKTLLWWHGQFKPVL